MGKRRKAAPGSAAFQPCSTSGHGVQRPAGYSISIHERGRRAGRSLGCRKTDRPQAGGPLWFVVRCICHAPPARGVFQAAVGSGCHSSTAPPPPWEGWRVPQGSPASPWEGVSKFHYPPRCRRARPATAGSKVRVDRSVRSLFTSSELPSWRRAFCRYSRGFCAWNTVYSVVSGRLVPPHLSGGFFAVCCVGQQGFFKISRKFFKPNSIERVIWLLFTPSALAIAVTLRPRMKRT